MWFPDFHQIEFKRNKNYWNSLFIGVFSWLLFLPKLAWFSAVPIVATMWKFITAFITVVLAMPILGLLGLVSAENISEAESFRRSLERLQKH